MKKRVRTMFAMMLVLAMSFALAGCGNSYGEKAAASEAYDGMAAPAATGNYMGEYEEYGDYDYVEEASYEESVDATMTDSQAQSAAAKNRKLIKTVDMSVETYEFDRLIAGIEAQTNTLGGYIEYSNIDQDSSYYNDELTYLKYANITVRVPSDKIDEFVKKVSNDSNVVNKTSQVEDVTLSYVDMESHKKSLQTEEDRLLVLLDQADDLDEILVLEERMAEVRYEIESMESQLRSMDNKVDYGTVSLYIREVKEYTPIIVEEPSRWDRIKDGFVDNCISVLDGFADFLSAIIIALPILLVWGIIIFVIVRIILSIVRKQREKKALAMGYAVPTKQQRKEMKKAAKAAKKANVGTPVNQQQMASVNQASVFSTQIDTNINQTVNGDAAQGNQTDDK